MATVIASMAANVTGVANDAAANASGTASIHAAAQEYVGLHPNQVCSRKSRAACKKSNVDE